MNLSKAPHRNEQVSAVAQVRARAAGVVGLALVALLLSSAAAEVNAAAPNSMLREKLLSGEPLHFSADTPEEARTILGEWLEGAARRSVKIDVRNAVILGAINLEYIVFEEEVSLIGCDFKEPADFSFTAFKRNLILSGTKFRQGASFRAATFEYDAVLNEAKFLAREASFQDLRTHGHFQAQGVTFVEGILADFSGARLDLSAFFRGAHFEGQASFIDAHFGGQAHFQGAVFKQGVSFEGARIDGSAFFDKKPELNLPAATFAAEASFIGAHFGGQAHFRGVQFNSPNKWVSFAGARIDGSAFFGKKPELNLPAATFAAEASFIGAHFGGQAHFQGVMFKQGVNFDEAKINGIAFFLQAIFAGEATFRGHFGGQAAFQGAVFKERVSFNGATIDHRALFRSEPALGLPAATFGGEANFGGIHIGPSAEFQGAQFNSTDKPVRFDDAKVDGSVFFEGARFAGEATFIGIHIGSSAEFQRAQFNSTDKPVRFDNAKVDGSAIFTEAKFLGEARFIAGRIGLQAAFNSAEFNKPTTFETMDIRGSAVFREARFLKGSNPSFLGTDFRRGAFFQRATFEDPVDFHTAQFHVEARFSGIRFHREANFNASYFEGLADFGSAKGLPGTEFNKVSFDHARFERDARFDDAVFQGAASFREASFRTVYFSPNGAVDRKDQFQGTVDLRGCIYDRIQVSWRSMLRQRDGSSRLSEIDRQPYTQLEKVLRNVGKDREADEVYLERWQVEREQKWRHGEFGAWMVSQIYALLANYGVRPYRLISFTVLFVFLGTFIFSRPGAVQMKLAPERATQPAESTAVIEGNAAASTEKSVKLSAWDALRLSIGLFLPVEVPLAASWKPSDRRFMLLKFSDFGTMLKLAGWVLVPLGIAALAGLLRRVAQ